MQLIETLHVSSSLVPAGDEVKCNIVMLDDVVDELTGSVGTSLELFELGLAMTFRPAKIFSECGNAQQLLAHMLKTNPAGTFCRGSSH